MLKTIEELRKFFEADRFAAEMGAVITECGEGGATVEMDAGPRHLNAAGTVQGGAEKSGILPFVTGAAPP